MDETTASGPRTQTDRPPMIGTAPHETPMDREEQVAQLADDLARLLRGLARARSQFLARARNDMEWAAQILISHLAANGPMRLGALATSVQSDPSTVSRQIAGLVRDGYVERRADPDDGRAVVLGVTEAGRQVHRDHIRVRNERYSAMLANWSSEDVVTLAALLRRFGNAMEIHQPTWSASGPTTRLRRQNEPGGDRGGEPGTRPGGGSEDPDGPDGPDGPRADTGARPVGDPTTGRGVSTAEEGSR
ncbi:MarR family winged helix-turn-helix transcriptional regulator [Frankia sp. EI5c]|uniref:MarR family winged helix-turn-helix transcriptional regulator n=1 Tax=Frankia sp. EI5c TaxID=683316 RepID=UPI000FF8AD1A|nr:MarR family transcriptional regulator [Frankia sp. EI5c]